METNIHFMTNLFDQLGLPSTATEIDKFIASHRPLAAQITLSDAPFWSSSQARFLREQIKNDADWAELVDRLDTSLRN